MKSILASCRILPFIAPILFTSSLFAQTQTTFIGKLDNQLHVDPRGYMYAAFDQASIVDQKKLDLPLPPSDKLYLGRVTLPTNPPLQFNAAIIRSPDGTDVLYVDTNRDSRFQPSERVAFRSLAGTTMGAKLKNKADFTVPLPSGPYSTCPMEIQLVRADVQGPPIGPNQLAVIPYSGGAFVDGEVRLPDRTLHMRFDYSFKKNSVDLPNSTEYVDLDGDGNFDETPGSPEIVRARGKPPVFRVGTTFYSVESIDLATNTFVLRSRAQQEYERFDLAIGSVVPDFTFTGFDGVSHRLSDVKAKYRLLDFWGSWCRPCVASLPDQKKVYEEFHSRGFEIVGIDGEEDNPENPQKLLRDLNIPWPQARFDKDLIENKFQVALWPTLILVDAQGKIVSMGEPNHLPLDADNLERTLKTLLPASQ